jgi:dihydrofolate synthase / folylpolyglutamate synthase
VRDRLYALETFGIKLGLENITRLCAALGNPERQFLSLHVAGTNGKGSVSAFVHAALLAAGLPTARYTSPHLVDLRERFVIGNQPVDNHTLMLVATHVLDTADRLLATGVLAAPPTFFEATTAIAFELFRRAEVEVAVVEVGLGGRFDATNVIAAPVGAITSIAFDHEEHLGRTLKAIAFEKAGIIKPRMSVVTGRLPNEADAVVGDAVSERGATWVRAFADAEIGSEMTDGRARLTVRTPEDQYGPVVLGLRGEHQVGNALVAIRVLEAARAHGIAIGRDAIVAGLTNAEWPARLERIEVAPGRELLLDAAHNVEGAQALAAYLARWHRERPPLVIGIMADKDVDGILRALLPVTASIVATASMNRRALPAATLADRVRALDLRRQVVVEPHAAAAVARAFEDADFVCVAGSIYLAGEVRDAIERRAILH